MNPAPAPASPEQLRHLIPSPIPEGTLPGAPNPIDCQSFAMRGIITRRTALMDTLVRSRMKPEDPEQSAGTARSLLELTAVLSHKRAANLPITPEGQVDPLDKAVNLLMGSFTHPPVPDLLYSYFEEIDKLLPDGEKATEPDDIQRRFIEDVTQLSEARQSGREPNKGERQRAAYSSLRMICLLGTQEDFNGMEKELPSLMASLIREYHLGEEIGEAVGMKFGGKGEVKTAGMEKGKIPLSMLLDEHNFPKSETELAHIKKTMLVGEGIKPLRMPENLTTLRDQQKKDLSLAKIVEQIRSPGDLRVLATNGQISVYALRIPHPDRKDIRDIYEIADAYLNLVVAVGPHCAPVILKDSSLQEGYAPNESRPEKYEEGHYHNYFEELDHDHDISIERFTSSYPIPADQSGIFCGLNDEKNNSSAGHFWFISNSGERISSPRCDWFNIDESGRLPSGEKVFVIHDNYTLGYDRCMTYDPQKHQFVEIPDSRAEEVHYYNLEDEFGYIYKYNYGQGGELIFKDRQGKSTKFRLHPDLRINWFYGANTGDFVSFDIASNSYGTPENKINNTPDKILIMKSGNDLVVGYALRGDVSKLESDERVLKYDPQTNFIQSTLADPYSLESVLTILTYDRPTSENNGNIGLWIRREPVITDSPLHQAKIFDLMPIIYRQMTALPDVLATIPAQPDNSALTHPTRKIDNLHSQLSSILTPIVDSSSRRARESTKYQDYLRLKPALTRVINANMTQLRERLRQLGEKGAIQSDEAKEFTSRLTILNGMLLGLPD